MAHNSQIFIMCHCMHAVCNHLYNTTPTQSKTFFKCGVRVAGVIHHHHLTWWELIVKDQFVLVFFFFTTLSVRGEQLRQLTTAAARSTPRDVQLRTSASTPDTIILQGGTQINREGTGHRLCSIIYLSKDPEITTRCLGSCPSETQWSMINTTYSSTQMVHRGLDRARAQRPNWSELSNDCHLLRNNISIKMNLHLCLWTKWKTDCTSLYTTRQILY